MYMDTTTINMGTKRMADLKYRRDPIDIQERSFEMIRDETDLSRFPGTLEPAVVRMIHACGDTAIAPDIAFSDDAGTAGVEALRACAPIFADSRMVAQGVSKALLPMNNAIFCTLSQAKAINTTRSAAAVNLWRKNLHGGVVAIGNAPTALYRLLEIIAEGPERPALIIGVPVGFVGAAESKEALIAHADGIPYITLRGRRGGSAIAAACVNALARIASK